MNPKMKATKTSIRQDESLQKVETGLSSSADTRHPMRPKRYQQTKQVRQNQPEQEESGSHRPQNIPSLAKNTPTNASLSFTCNRVSFGTTAKTTPEMKSSTVLMTVSQPHTQPRTRQRAKRHPWSTGQSRDIKLLFPELGQRSRTRRRMMAKKTKTRRSLWICPKETKTKTRMALPPIQSGLCKQMQRKDKTSVHRQQQLTIGRTTINLLLMRSDWLLEKIMRTMCVQRPRVFVIPLTPWYICMYQKGILPYGISHYKSGLPLGVSHLSAYLGMHTARPPGWWHGCGA